MAKELPNEIYLMSDVAKAMAESHDLKKALDQVLLALETRLKLQMVAITLFNNDREDAELTVIRSISEEAKKLGEQKIGSSSVLKTGHSVVVPDIEADSRFSGKGGKRASQDGRNVAFISTAIMLEDKVIGTLSVSREIATSDTLAEDLELLDIIASLIGEAVRLNFFFEGQKAAWQEENRALRQQLKTRFDVNNMLGSSNAIQEVFRLVEQVAQSNATVIIRGEGGTGKDLIARAIHYNSLRAGKPFVKINCTALPEALLESELFGHEKGAFVGAVERKIGRFERANGGTILLDEIGNFSMNLQVKLLRVIQFKEFERVGGHESIKANVRIIVATNRNLEEDIKSDVFCEDLYCRINVFPIYLPPLRERKDDIMLLADHFLERYSKDNNKTITRISTPAIEMLTCYHWPGNIRELENCIERAVLLCDDEVIRSEHLPPSLQLEHDHANSTGRTMPETVANLEREMIVESLKKNGGQRRKVAKSLGVTERVLGYKIKKYHIHPKQLV